MTRDRFLQLADLLPEPTLLVTSEAEIVAANRAAQAQLGLAARSRPVVNLYEIVADPVESLRRYLRSCSRSREMIPGAITITGNGGEESVAYRAQGAVFEPAAANAPALVLLRLLPKSVAVGRFLALNQRIDDLDRAIHQRKLAEQLLREQKERLRVTLFSIGDAVIVTDDAGRITSMNPIAEALTGWSQADAEGRKSAEVFRIVNEVTRQEVEGPVERVLREGAIVGLANHTVLTARNGSERPIDDSAAPIRHTNGTLIGVVLVFRDVTERREAEQRLMRSQEELRARALELADAHRRKDEFLATLAHELRNPLAPLRNSLELLQRSPSNAEIHGPACELMQRQMNHLVRLVDDLLDVSRITRGALSLRRQRVLLSDVVANAVETTRSLFEGSGHHLAIRLPRERIELDADPIRIGQVLANLLNNAAKYTPPPGQIELAAERRGLEVAVSVRDNGIGLAHDELDSIFEMFFRADQSLERAHGGLGVGLTLVRRLVEMHGGRVSAHSEGRGKGSRFTVTLPVAHAEPASPAVVSDSSWTSPALQGLTLLVVDDNRDSADSLALLLNSLGHFCKAVYNGEAGLRAATELRPDIVFLDIGMPGMNGYEVARRLRDQPALRGTRLVAISGWGQDEDRRRGREAGFDAHLVKPVDLRELEALIAQSRDTTAPGL